MMVMTAKVNMKKLAITAVAVVGVILALVLIFGGGSDVQPTAAQSFSNNDARVKFLADLGWDVTTSPTESGQVRIPQEQSAVYQRYNDLQKSQGYDLSQFAGKAVMRYVYRINNFPGATEPVYATLLIYKNQIIGGDITDTAARGVVQGLQKRPAVQQTEPITTEPSTQATA